MKLILVRHGENIANITKEFSYRHVDYSLTERGKMQAEQTAFFLKDLEVDKIYSSPLKRALETAEYISEKLKKEIFIDERLREVNVGDLELSPPNEKNWNIYNSIMRIWRDRESDTSFPNGESGFELRKRFIDFIFDVYESSRSGTVIVVAHAGILTNGISEILNNFERQNIFDLENHNCSISEIEIDIIDNRIEHKLHIWGNISHLHGEARNVIGALK